MTHGSGPIGRGSATPRAQRGAMTWVDRAASHVEVAAELGHQRLAAEAESHPSSRQEGGGQSRALGCGTQIQQEGQETGVLE